MKRFGSILRCLGRCRRRNTVGRGGASLWHGVCPVFIGEMHAVRFAASHGVSTLNQRNFTATFLGGTWFSRILNHWGDLGSARNWFVSLVNFMQISERTSSEFQQNHGSLVPGSKPSIPTCEKLAVFPLHRFSAPSSPNSHVWPRALARLSDESKSGKCCELLFVCVRCTESYGINTVDASEMGFTCHPVESDTWNSYDVWWYSRLDFWSIKGSAISTSLGWFSHSLQNQQVKLMDHGGVSIGRDWVSNSW